MPLVALPCRPALRVYDYKRIYPFLKFGILDLQKAKGAQSLLTRRCQACIKRPARLSRGWPEYEWSPQRLHAPGLCPSLQATARTIPLPAQLFRHGQDGASLAHGHSGGNGETSRVGL